MFADFKHEEMIRDFKIRKTRDWLRFMKIDVALKNGDTVKVRGCFNIKKYHRGQVVQHYVLFDFLSPAELGEIANEYKEKSNVFRIIEQRLNAIISEQLEINFEGDG